jgi:arsenite methyltransferase
VWSEIYRLLQNGGRFVISDIYSSEPVPAEYANDPVAVAECWAGSIPKNEYLKSSNRLVLKQVKILGRKQALSQRQNRGVELYHYRYQR